MKCFFVVVSKSTSFNFFFEEFLKVCCIYEELNIYSFLKMDH